MRHFPRRYDNHREQILRGSHTDYEDDSLDIFPYFTAACYKGFGDDAAGFYAVYAKVFDQLAAEDIEFMDSADEYEQIPKFGTSQSDYESCVGPFYAFWQSYCTKKTYAWLCPHDITQIRDRRILREVEKETKKIAQKKRKERNDEVRALVSFCRKRDKRVQEYRKHLEAKAEQNRLKQQQHRLAQLKKNQLEASEMRKVNTFDVDHEEQLKQLEQAYGSDSDTESDDPEDDCENENDDTATDDVYFDDLYCVACNKAFKNILSMDNHESSKKHRENTARMKKQMRQEEKELAHENTNDIDDLPDATKSDDKEQEDSDLEAPLNEPKSSKKASKKSKKSKQRQLHNEDDSDEVESINDLLTNSGFGCVSDSNDDWGDDSKKKKKKIRNNKVNKTDGLAKSTKKEVTKEPTKKKEKSTKSVNNGEDSVDTDHICVTCNSTFESKNKLFTHLKKTNHSVFIKN